MGSLSTIYNGVRTWIAGRALMDVAFSNRSTNGLQNKVITAKKDEIEGRLDSIEDVLTAVTLDTSTSLDVNTDYVASNDGYLRISSATSANAGVIRADIKDGDNNEIAQIIYRNSPSSADTTSIYIKKGLHIMLTDKGGNSSAYFRTLKK